MKALSLSVYIYIYIYVLGSSYLCHIVGTVDQAAGLRLEPARSPLVQDSANIIYVTN